MQRFRSSLALLFITATAALAGCDQSEDSGMVGGKASPPIGSYVTVQYRRDYLGVAGDAKVGVMGEAAPNSVASGGTMKRMTDEFLVLGVDNEPNRELWIPRDAILLMDVRKTK